LIRFSLCLFLWIKVLVVAALLVDTKNLGHLQFQLRVLESTPTDYYLNLRSQRINLKRRLPHSYLLDWKDLPQGKLRFFLETGTGLRLYSGSFYIQKNRLTQVKLKLDGPEEGPWDRPYHGSLIVTGGRWQGVKRSYYPGWTESNLADGSKEIHYRGFVHGELISGKNYARFDLDNDFLDDSEDLDDDNDGIPDTRDTDDDNDGLPDNRDKHDTDNDNDGILNSLELSDQVMGRLQFPIVEDVSVDNLTHPEKGLHGMAGDLLRIRARVNSAGGGAVKTVELMIYQDHRRILSETLLDDASLLDLDPGVKGRQVSGDIASEDGWFTRILVLNRSSWSSLYKAVWIIQAENRYGRKSNTWSLYVPTVSEPDWDVPDWDESEWVDKSSLRSLRFRRNLNSSRDYVDSVEVNLQLSRECEMRIHHRDSVVYLFPLKKALQFPVYFARVAVQPGDLLLLSAVCSSEEVFYFGERY
jgi:hypothetical protein